MSLITDEIYRAYSYGLIDYETMVERLKKVNDGTNN